MSLSRRSLLVGLGGAAGASLIGAAEAKPTKPPGKPGQANVKAFSDGVGMRDFKLIVGPPGGGGGSSQSPVSLVAADGETLSGGVQSNFAGNDVWTRKGWTRATSWSGPKPGGGTYSGFGDINFIPICVWLASVPPGDTAFYTRCTDLGVNGFLPSYWETPLDDVTAGGKWAVVTNPDVTSIPSGNDPSVIGVTSGEEPSSRTQFEGYAADNDAWLAGAEGAGRFGLYNFADHLLDRIEDGDVPRTELVAAGDWITCDQYWIAGATPYSPGSGSSNKLDYRLYQLGVADPSFTPAQAARGSHYGSMLDSIRSSFTLPSTPFGVWVENGAPYDPANTLEITPTQMKWAVWATLVHGARSIHYFNHTFRAGDPSGGSFNNFNNNYYGGPGVAGTGIYAAAKSINNNALSIAPVINSPFDGYFCFGQVIYPNAETTGRIDTPGFLTAVTSTNSRLAFSGVDASCKWYPTEGKHYIFSTTREPEASTSIPVTFRMVDQGQTSAVRLFDTTGTITVQRGGAIPGGFCEFSDTFATAASYKCYRID